MADKDTLPPTGSYDPGILAELRASGRGLEDLLLDLRRERKITRQDSRVERKDIRTQGKRGKQDFATQLARGRQDIGFQRQDVRQGRERGREDFASSLANLTRNYTQLGGQQGQSINAAGGGATSGAARLATQRRSENMALERKPLDTSLTRLEEDSATQIGRLGISEQQLERDTRQGRRRLKQDVRHDTKLNRLDLRRGIRDIKLRKQRGIREGEFAKSDLTAAAVFDARNRRKAGF